MGQNKYPDFRVRIPPELKEKIRASSEKYNRSMGADIIARLEQTFEKEEESDNSILLNFDDEWYEESGLTREQTATAFKRLLGEAVKTIDN